MAKQKVVQIILTEPARTNAARALNAGSGFKGPTFFDAKVKVGAGSVSVDCGDAVYTYPFHTVARVKEYTQEVADASTTS